MTESVASLEIQPKLTHIALRVQNIERSVEFYERYSSLKLISIRHEKDGRVAWLGNSQVKRDFVIVLLEFPFEKTNAPRFHHLGLDVPSQEAVDRIAEVARNENILEMEPKDHGPIVGYFCMVRDPDENMVEFSFGQKIGEALKETELKPKAQPR